MTPGESPRARRGRILSVARRVFAERGYHRASVAEIAAALPIGHGTFYRNFASKLELFESVITEAMRTLCETMRLVDATASSCLAEYRRQIEGLSNSVLELSSANPDLAQLLLEDAQVASPELAARLDEGWAECSGLTELHLLHGVRRGYLAAELDTQTTALALNAMIFEGARRAGRKPGPRGRFEGARWSATVGNLLVAPVGGLIPTLDHRVTDPTWTSRGGGL